VFDLGCRGGSPGEDRFAVSRNRPAAGVPPHASRRGKAAGGAELRANPLTRKLLHQKPDQIALILLPERLQQPLRHLALRELL
jgi:hypothetical protein